MGLVIDGAEERTVRARSGTDGSHTQLCLHGDKEAKMDPSRGGKLRGPDVCRRVWSGGRGCGAWCVWVDTSVGPGHVGPNPMEIGRAHV